MIDACRDADVRLMIAYRLHFEDAEPGGRRPVRRGRIGEPKFFNSSSDDGDRREHSHASDLGGGSLYDIGVYCINAARYLFGAEPKEVLAISVNSGDQRLREIDESTGALSALRRRAARRVRHQFQFGRCRRVTVSSGRGGLTPIPPMNTRKGCNTP